MIASTDFDHEQAEVFTIQTKPGPNNITFRAEVKYEHYGANSRDCIDIFAEVQYMKTQRLRDTQNYNILIRLQVGLLTRKIKIYGEVEDECYDEDISKCAT